MLIMIKKILKHQLQAEVKIINTKYLLETNLPSSQLILERNVNEALGN